MTKTKWLMTAAAAAAVAAGVASMSVRHEQRATTARRAELTTPQISSEAIQEALRKANLPLEQLIVRSAGGIVILRGTADAETADKAVALVRGLGAQRVANLITPASVVDDESIRRQAERNLANNSALAGSVLRVSCENGVLRVTGTVRHELQKDAARSALRGIRGAQRVELELTKL